MEAITDDWPGWYYTIELTPGVWSQGHEFPSVGLTRRLLSRVAVKGKDCLDIGCMEGLVSRLMGRRGGLVDAWDRVDQRQFLGVGDSNPRWVGPLQGRQTLRQFVVGPGMPGVYDVVVYSGVLYHVLDPLGSLLHARQMVRHGGILVIETAAVNLPGHELHFNSAGRYYPDAAQGDYWFPTVSLLRYLLELCRLEPLDVCWFAQPTLHRDLVRVAIACRASPLVIAEDNWARAHQTAGPDSQITLNFAEFIDWGRCSLNLVDVPYEERPARPMFPLDSADRMTDEELGPLSVLRLSDVV